MVSPICVCQNAEPGVHGHEMDAGPPALGPPLPLADSRPGCSGKGKSIPVPGPSKKYCFKCLARRKITKIESNAKCYLKDIEL